MAVHILTIPFDPEHQCFPDDDLRHFLANVYLDPLDHRIKEQWRVAGYLRYMDDWVLFDEDPRRLTCYAQAIDEYLWTRLALRPKPGGTWINRASHGLSFVGMRIFRQTIFPRGVSRRRCLVRMQRRLAAWRAGRLDDAGLAQSQASALGHLRYFTPGYRVTPALRSSRCGSTVADGTGP
jgi:RNA-directed DNA polymerase